MAHHPGTDFRALHQAGNPFVLANAWDAGSAKVLAGLGARAIGTSSAAHAFTLGRPDMGHVSRDEALSHAADLVAAVNIPVSGDFENGYGEAPDTVAQTVRLAAEAGLAGICIEDTALPDMTPYDFDLAVERIRAGAAAARALSRDFFLVARADGIMTGQYDIDEGLRRIRAFDTAGADGLFAPLPKSVADLRRIIKATKKPVNVIAVGPLFSTMRRDEFAALGAARISLGSGLARATHSVIHAGARAIFQDGDFSALLPDVPRHVIDALLG